MLHRRQAFTLVELLVVISIIALLLAILMPALARVKEQAKQVVCASQIKQWGLCLQQYAIDNKDSYPEGWNKAGDMKGQWMYALEKYYNPGGDPSKQTLQLGKPLKHRKMLLCPAAAVYHPTFDFKYTQWMVNEGGANYYACEGYMTSYNFNRWIYNVPAQFQTGRGVINGVDNHDKRGGWRTSSGLIQPSNVPLMGDGTWYGSWPEPEDRPPQYPCQPAGSSYTDMMRYFSIDRHPAGAAGGINMTFGDGSARKVGVKEVWYLNWSKIYKSKLHLLPKTWPAWMNKYKNSR